MEPGNGAASGNTESSGQKRRRDAQPSDGEDGRDTFCLKIRQKKEKYSGDELTPEQNKQIMEAAQEQINKNVEVLLS